MADALKEWRRALGVRTDVPAGNAPANESATQRVTRRNNERLEGGVHPATLQPLFIGTGEVCASCEHLHSYRYHNRIYHKCELHRLGESHSDASDVRLYWPACALFVPDPIIREGGS